jgi:hypothetical protein
MKSLSTRFKEEVFSSYVELLKAGYRFHPKFAHTKRIWEESLSMEKLVNGPYLEKSQMYALGNPLNHLQLHEKTNNTIRKRLGVRSLYKHQTDAINLILSGKNAIIATGTSSGKTFCYQIPILDDLLRNPSPGLRAIIIYPLNALVNDQLNEWEQILKDYNDIIFARFTGQTPTDQKVYESRLKEVLREQLADRHLTQQQLHREIQFRLEEQLKSDPTNRLNHRDDIRTRPPQVLITNFSMLEYLMERPVDAPIFEAARLKFLVLDEVHAYRGVQATEIAFLVRRLKDRLGLERLTCIATSATLGNPDDFASKDKVREFASALFDEEFAEQNPIYGTPARPELSKPSFRPFPAQYIEAADFLRNNKESAARNALSANVQTDTLDELLIHDENLYRLRKEILTKPTLLKKAAQSLWPTDPRAEDGLQALLEIAAAVKQDDSHDDLLPTRLHYFVRSQDGLHVCLHLDCPGRREGKAAYLVSRKNGEDVPEGMCPYCWHSGHSSNLVEVVTCRKCGYLYGAFQDLGPRRAQNPDTEKEESRPHFDSFSTELGWAADSFWSYFSVEDDLPWPTQLKTDDEDEDQGKLLLNPAEVEWCVVCGKKSDKGAGDNCKCSTPHLRKIKIFHRQCPSNDRENIYSQEKKMLTTCPNCGARNGSGIEPVRRFQESDDETGLSMAIPLAHFQVTPPKDNEKPVRKLLCFTDHRQRAAAFPALLEEETFTHDLGRKIVEIVHAESKSLDLVSIGEKLAEIADPQSDQYDPDFFLPASRFPDEELDAKGKRNLWLAEIFSYFGIPDSARESAEDLGLVAVEYRVEDFEQMAFHQLLKKPEISMAESTATLQTLLSFIRKRKAFTLPKGRVENDATAFGRVTADIAYAKVYAGSSIIGWLPRRNKDGTYRDNIITDYLKRLLNLTGDESFQLAEIIWEFLTTKFLLVDNRNRNKWKLDHERLFIRKPEMRYVCDRCGVITAYDTRQCCPQKECTGKLDPREFEPNQETIIACWVAGKGLPRFRTLKSEEHTAQIKKDLAKRIEDEFRDEGVNLLSSTTTFELGINIGDLQKVLLRNAPPTKSSYVQRVGRAGRGVDKNAVCVTLCRRTKYDADAWSNPALLMLGDVRTPTVFTKNCIISQRHFNAVAFARFLKIKVADEKLLGQGIHQQIPLGGFLPNEIRQKIPESWDRVDQSIDFTEWLGHCYEADIFQTGAGCLLMDTSYGFEKAIKKTESEYEEVVQAICEELAELLAERRRLYNQGHSTDDVERAVKNILNSDVIAIFAKHGFLPRYAFPLDVVTLETGWSRWTRDTDVELSRDRSIAIAEFAPGAQVIARKRVFTSAGLYIVSSKDKPERKWYAKCPDCEQIRISPTKEPLKGNCPVCKRSIISQFIKPFVEPKTFSVRMDKKSKSGERQRRSSLIRQRQSLTHFIDQLEEKEFEDFGFFRVALKENGNLFRYNQGPENKGFKLCPVCGYSQPGRGFKLGGNHKKLRPFSGLLECSNTNFWLNPLAYGHQFESFCLIIRPNFSNTPLIESLAFALQKGLCRLLELETSDIGVSWRWLSKRKIEYSRAEIILYDRTPGGAGFVRDGFENWQEVVEHAYEICNSCSCTKACYDCLKDYSNQAYHERLSRIDTRGLLKP